MTNDDSLTSRTYRLLNEAKYLNLATVSAGHEPWAAVMQYAWLPDPLRFVFGSAVGSRHSRHIVASRRVSGSLYVAGGSDAGFMAVDGAQFTGDCSEIDPGDLDTFYSVFYEAVFPDADERAAWMLPPSMLRAPAEHRLYLISVDRWWLIDTRTWAQDRIDRRIEVPLTGGAGVPQGGRPGGEHP